MGNNNTTPKQNKSFSYTITPARDEGMTRHRSLDNQRYLSVETPTHSFTPLRISKQKKEFEAEGASPISKRHTTPVKMCASPFNPTSKDIWNIIDPRSPSSRSPTHAIVRTPIKSVIQEKNPNLSVHTPKLESENTGSQSMRKYLLVSNTDKNTTSKNNQDNTSMDEDLLKLDAPIQRSVLRNIDKDQPINKDAKPKKKRNSDVLKKIEDARKTNESSTKQTMFKPKANSDAFAFDLDEKENEHIRKKKYDTMTNAQDQQHQHYYESNNSNSSTQRRLNMIR